MKPDIPVLARVLAEIEQQCPMRERKTIDPVSFVWAFDLDADRELVGLLASSMAFGNVTTIGNKLRELLMVISTKTGRHRRILNSRFSLDRLIVDLRDFRHRLFVGEDCARLVFAVREMQIAHGSIENYFCHAFEANQRSLQIALARTVSELRTLGSIGSSHLLSAPEKGSSCKRLLLFLRWMVRGPDAIDLGVWHSIEPKCLQIPVDVHVHRFALAHGLTARRSPSWSMSAEITDVLRKIDADDPVRFDFAICHWGMMNSKKVRAPTGDLT